MVPIAPAPLLTGLRRLHHRVPGVVEVSRRVLTRRGVAAADHAAVEALAQRHPAGARRRRTRHTPGRSASGSGGTRRAHGRRCPAADRPWRRPADVLALAARPRRRASTPRHRASPGRRRPPRRRRAGVADLQHPRALGVDHRDAGSARTARWGSPRQRRCRAVPRRRSCAARPAAGPARARRAGRRTPACPAPLEPALDACCSSVARASASSIGSGEGTLSRRASPGQRQPLDEQRPRHHREGDQQQDLPVRRVARGSRRRRPA